MRNLIILAIGLLCCGFSFGQDLEMLIDEAMKNSPEIQKFELQHNIVSEKVNEAKTVGQ